MNLFRSNRVFPGRAFFLSLLWVAPMQASKILTPSSSLLLAGTEFYPAANITNGSGLSAAPTAENFSTITHAAASGSTAWTTDAPGGGSADYFALGEASAPTPVFLFEFAEAHEFTHFIYWGYHFGRANGNEAKSFTLDFSEDGGNTFVRSLDLTSPAISTLNATSFDFGESIPADTIRLTLTDNWFDDFGGGDRVGLGEIRFLGETPPNPNPVIETQGLVDFGSFPTNPGQTTFQLPISNLGDLNELVVIPSLSESSPFAVPNDSLTIPAGETSLLALTFESSTDGCFSETLTLETNDPEKPIVAITLIGAINCSFPQADQPIFSHEEGTFTGEFLLTLTSPTPGATLIYTLDGSLPEAGNGWVYESPILIDATTQVRAASYFPGQDPAIRTRSFVRLADDLAAYTSELPIMVVENFNRGLIPNKNWSTSTQTGGGLRQVARQPAFLGIFDRDPDSSLASLNSLPDQTSRIGIRVRGAFSSTWPRKPYSVKTWKTFEDSGRSIKILDMASDDDWILYYPDPGYDRSLLYNTFIWELSRQTGRWAPEFRFVDVFINQNGGDLTLSDRIGVYVFLEKPKRGDKRLDFKKLSEDGSTGGWLNSINRMDPIPVDGFPAENGATTPQFFHTAGPNRIQSTPPNVSGSGDDIPRQYNAFINFENPNGYQITPPKRNAIESWYRDFEDIFFDNNRWLDPEQGYRQHLDTTDFIDYLQLLTLAKQGDGLLLSMFPWVSSDDRKLRMGPMWDFNNGAYGGSATGTLYFRPDRLWYDRLFEDPGFQREYEDRWFELRRGPLSNENMAAIIDAQATTLTTGLADQQAGLSGSTWNSRINAMKSWLQTRATWIDSNFLAPPSFNLSGGITPFGALLSIHPPIGETGTLHYTTDGSDPIDSGLAYSSPLSLTTSTRISTRLQSTDGSWSALMSETFVVGSHADSSNLVISEIHYHPADEFPGTEFIELQNTSDATIDLSLVRFTRGLSFEFPAGSLLGPGERIVVVEDRPSFIDRYGTAARIAGEFADFTRLDNSGERLALAAADGSLIVDFTYNDKDPWSEFADGAGHSLTLIQDSSNPALPESWRPSVSPGGSPGDLDSTPFLNGDLTLHALGTTPPFLSNGIFHVQTNLGADDFQIIPQSSPDLVNWTDLTLPTQPDQISLDGFASYSLPIPPTEARRFLRLEIRPR